MYSNKNILKNYSNFCFWSSINVSRQMSIRFNTNIFSFHAYYVVIGLGSVIINGIIITINNIIFLTWHVQDIICQSTIMSVRFCMIGIICILIGTVFTLVRFVPMKKCRYLKQNQQCKLQNKIKQSSGFKIVHWNTGSVITNKLDEIYCLRDYCIMQYDIRPKFTKVGYWMW
jgi:hypothetical protein